MRQVMRRMKINGKPTFGKSTTGPLLNFQQHQYLQGATSIYGIKLSERSLFRIRFLIFLLKIYLTKNRKSQNRHLVHKIAQTVATVTSCVKNWYIIFFYRYCWTLGNANWCQNTDFLAKSEFRLQGL